MKPIVELNVLPWTDEDDPRHRNNPNYVKATMPAEVGGYVPALGTYTKLLVNGVVRESIRVSVYDIPGNVVVVKLFALTEKRLQAKDLVDYVVLARIDEIKKTQNRNSTWHLGLPNSIATALPQINHTNKRVLLAKLKSLHKRGFIGGCACGCNGGFHLTQRGQVGLALGKDYLAAESQAQQAITKALAAKPTVVTPKDCVTTTRIADEPLPAGSVRADATNKLDPGARVLFTNQTDASKNGVYIVKQEPDPKSVRHYYAGDAGAGDRPVVFYYDGNCRMLSRWERLLIWLGRLDPMKVAYKPS
jgi:hypothetical protein